MRLISNHLVLVSASSFRSGCTHAQNFFHNTLLVRYDKIDVREDKCCGGGDTKIKDALKNGVEANRKILNNFIEEFKKTGFQTVDDLTTVEQGYPSKMLHIISHFIDGFIGIDSVFYNLIEDSHWVSVETIAAIDAAPEKFWLISLDCYSETHGKASLFHQ